MSKKWVQKAVKRPGRMMKWCKSHGYKGVTMSCLQEAKAVAKKRDNKSLAAAAQLAIRFKKGL